MKQLVNRFVSLTHEKRALEEKQKALSGKLREAESVLLGRLMESGMENVPGPAGETVYIRNRFQAGAARGTAELCEVLKRSDATRWLVRDTVHAAQLSSWVKEMLRGEGLPVELESEIKVQEVKRLSMRDAP